MDRRTFIGTLAGLIAAPLAAEAQQTTKVYRIGFLGPSSASGQVNRVEALRTGLLELGYVEGKNVVIEYRWAEEKYDRLPNLAAELVGLKVDVLVTAGTPGTLAGQADNHNDTYCHGDHRRRGGYGPRRQPRAAWRKCDRVHGLRPRA